MAKCKNCSTIKNGSLELLQVIIVTIQFHIAIIIHYTYVRAVVRGRPEGDFSTPGILGFKKRTEKEIPIQSIAISQPIIYAYDLFI